MKPFFSIIVPCCDVERYVRECLDSVLRQPFADWECLLGVETSKDRTEEIVREYAAKDSRFKVFTGPRSGSCSASRNTGIDKATGEYVIFLDGDDTVTDGSLQRLRTSTASCPVQRRRYGQNDPARTSAPCSSSRSSGGSSSLTTT